MKILLEFTYTNLGCNVKKQSVFLVKITKDFLNKALQLHNNIFENVTKNDGEKVGEKFDPNFPWLPP